eukprot:SAG22_NODE_10436_length_536_cov_0.489703_1_plen_103_part_00
MDEAYEAKVLEIAETEEGKAAAVEEFNERAERVEQDKLVAAQAEHAECRRRLAEAKAVSEPYRQLAVVVAGRLGKAYELDKREVMTMLAGHPTAAVEMLDVC